MNGRLWTFINCNLRFGISRAFLYLCSIRKQMTNGCRWQTKSVIQRVASRNSFINIINLWKKNSITVRYPANSYIVSTMLVHWRINVCDNRLLAALTLHAPSYKRCHLPYGLRQEENVITSSPCIPFGWHGDSNAY